MKMLKEETIKKIEEEAKKYYEELPPSHDWSHIERVGNLAGYIGKKEGANLYILKLVTALHDVGRKKESISGQDHAIISAKIAEPILKNHGLEKEIREQVLHCIISHRSRDEHRPKTIEAKSFFDADKLDAIGAIGIARAFAVCGERGLKLYSNKGFLGTGYEKEHSPLTEYLFKLSKIKEGMQTETGKVLALERDTYTKEFFERLQKEVEIL